MTWPSHQIPRKLPSANPTISSLSTESERTGNYLCLVPFFSIVYILVQFEAEVLIGFLVSPRGDKKVICNKFIQTVRKRDLMHCYCLEEWLCFLSKRFVKTWNFSFHKRNLLNSFSAYGFILLHSVALLSLKFRLIII